MMMPSVCSSFWNSSRQSMKNGVTTDADAGGLAQSHRGGLVNGFISQGARAGYNTDSAWLMNGSWHDADFAFTWGDDTRAVGADHDHIRVGVQYSSDFHHVQYRDTFGDGDNQLASTASRTASAANGGGTKITEALAPVSLTPSATVSNTGLSRCFEPPLPGVTPPTRLVP
jgi:hypothetical protein